MDYDARHSLYMHPKRQSRPFSSPQVPGTQQATSAFLVTELAVQELTGHLPVPCMADELERQCQRLDSLLEDEDYYAPEDADTYG